MNYLSPIGLSDQVGLIGKLNCSLAMRSSIPSCKYANWKGDYESMKTRLSEINWKTLLDGKSVQEMWNETRSCYDSCSRISRFLSSTCTEVSAVENIGQCGRLSQLSWLLGAL